MTSLLLSTWMIRIHFRSEKKNHNRSESESSQMSFLTSTVDAVMESLQLSFDPNLDSYIVIFDFKRCNDLDPSATLILEKVFRSFQDKKAKLYVTGLHPFHQRLFKRSGLFDILSQKHVFPSVEKAMAQVQKKRARTRTSASGALKTTR